MVDGSDWSLITVTYNSAEQLSACWGAADFGRANWIVVDNGSSDGSAKIAREIGACEVIEAKDNKGFSAGNNAGLEKVTTPWVAFVNPDVVINDPEELSRLAETLERTGGLVAPQLMNLDGSEQLNARGIPLPIQKLANRGIRLPGSDVREYARGSFNEPTYVAWVMGAAVAGPTEFVRSINGWDDRYFIYYEDHDIGLRSWKAGRPVVADPAVRWVHRWERATMHAKWQPWRHELQAMRRFYSTYPQLRTARTFRRWCADCEWVQQMDARLWAPVTSCDIGAQRVW